MYLILIKNKEVKTMNRVNEINKAAQEYCKKNIPSLYMRPIIEAAIETAFEAGAEYADKHPSRKLMIKVWNIAVAATVDQINGEIAYLETENEIVTYIKDRLKL